MKQLVISISAIAMLSSLAIAGKNTIPAPSEPLKIPEPAITAKNDGSVNLENLPLGLYLGGGFTYASSECKCKNKTSSQTTSSNNKGNSYGVNLKAGYDYNQYIGIEAKYLHTPWGDDGKALKHYGIYLKPNYAVDENIDLYGLLGYGKTESEMLQNSQKGFAWGLGGEYTIESSKGKNKGVGIYVEYLRPLKKKTPNEITTNVANVGVSYHY